ISDCSGNALDDSFSWVMGYAPQVGDLVINEIMADPDPSIDLPAAEFIELRNNTDQPINLQGVSFNGASIAGTFIIPAQGFTLVANAQYASNFQGYTTVLVDGFPALTNSGMLLEMTDGSGVLLDAVDYDLTWYRDPTRDDGGYTLERIDPLTACTGRLNWHAATNDAGGTPNAMNAAASLDNNNPPVAVQFGIVDTNSVYLIFNQPMDTLSSTFLPSDMVMVFNTLTAVHWNADRDRVELDFAIAFPPESSFVILVEQLANCDGQSLQTFVLNFQTGLSPQPGDLIINEIMADGTGSTQSVPKQDFVELLNTTNHWLDITNMTVNGVEFLQQALLPPNGYVVLTDVDSDSSSFAAIQSSVYFINDFPSLTEDGMLIELALHDDVIDAVTYSKRYYQDVSKESGGFSMERVNPSAPCNSWHNWRGCLFPIGNSAGARNSVYGTPVDSQGPALMHVLNEPQDAITLVFDEPITDSLMSEWSFVENGFPTVYEGLQIQGVEQDELVLPLGILPADAVLNIQLNGLRDCWLNPSSIQAFYTDPIEALPGEVIINEVLYNPLDGGTDFIEIYNASQKTVSLKDWKITDATNGGWNTPDVITQREILMEPGAYFILTKNGDHLQTFYPNAQINRVIRVEGMADFSSSDGVSVILPSFLSSDDLWYDESFHFPLLNSTDGVSLERISAAVSTDESSNWHSASATVGFATPGYLNSQTIAAEENSATWLASPDIISPDNDGYQDVLLLQYTMPLPGYVGSVRIFDSAGQLKRTLKQGELMGISGEWHWDGLTDDGQKASLGIHVVSLEAFHTSGDVIRKKIPCVVAHPID
ncbi:MAG: lamin tail domain-containing protein, partial [Flavobacteriales bacterium]